MRDKFIEYGIWIMAALTIANMAFKAFHGGYSEVNVLHATVVAGFAVTYSWLYSIAKTVSKIEEKGENNARAS